MLQSTQVNWWCVGRRPSRKHHTKELIAKQVGSLSPEVKTVLAQRFWAYGRGILREGYKKEATRYFETAIELSPKQCVNGNPPYPLLVKLLGAIRAELVLQGVKSRLKKA